MGTIPPFLFVSVFNSSWNLFAVKVQLFLSLEKLVKYKEGLTSKSQFVLKTLTDQFDSVILFSAKPCKSTIKLALWSAGSKTFWEFLLNVSLLETRLTSFAASPVLPSLEVEKFCLTSGNINC